MLQTQQKAVQRYLTNFSIVVIKQLENDDVYFLGNKSFIRTDMYLSRNINEKDFQNCLFYAEMDDKNRELGVQQMDFEQNILLRHKVSNKYLSYSENFQEEENDTTYRLQLSEKKYYFKIYPCFQYQIKISRKIKFDEEIYLATQINNAKLGFVSVRPRRTDPNRKNAIVGLNYKTKFSIKNYYECQKESNQYTYGCIVWLHHIQRFTFLKTEVINHKHQVLFDYIEQEKDLQSSSGLWLIESEKLQSGGKLHFEEKFRLKNLYSGAYLAFSKNYKLVGNERVYEIMLQEKPSQQSKFIFRSLKGEESTIKKGQYLIFRHYESKVYLGCRKNKKVELALNNSLIKVLLRPHTTSEFEDEDLFKITELNKDQDEAIRFIFSIREELEEISDFLKGQVNYEILQIFYGLYENIKKELIKLSLLGKGKLFEKVQDEVSNYIAEVSKHLLYYRHYHRCHPGTYLFTKTISQIYTILQYICKNHRKNQLLTYQCIQYYIEDIFTEVGAEELLIETFKSNYKLLCKVPEILPKLEGKNIVRAIIDILLKRGEHRAGTYWLKMKKILQFFQTLIFCNQSTIDINQRLLSIELFEKNLVKELFFEIKIQNQRIKAWYVPQLRDKEIEQIHEKRDTLYMCIIQELFRLFSSMCSSRNFIAKRYINNYLNKANKDGPEILISYLSMPISPRLCSILYTLITNLYVESYPRINRYRPLSIVNFVFEKKVIQQEEDEISSQLKQSLMNQLKEAYVSRPLEVNNKVKYGMNQEPSLSNDEIIHYKEQLNHNIECGSKKWSTDLLRSVCILLNLEEYSPEEIIEIYDFITKEVNPNLPVDLLGECIKVLNEIILYTQETELKKMAAFLKYKFNHGRQKITANSIRYMLPGSTRYSEIFSQNVGKLDSDIEQYNRLGRILESITPGKVFKQNLMLIFTNCKVQNKKGYLSSIFRLILNFSVPKYNFLLLVMNSIVITYDEAESFQRMYDLYKKIKHLISISEYWLCSNTSQQNNARDFQESMHELNSSFFKENSININRQLLIRNIGFHLVILELLETNFYLLEQKTKKQLMEKHEKTFKLCFEFILLFCKGCQENRQVIQQSWEILAIYRDLIEMGQIKVYNQVYADNEDYIKVIKLPFIERVFMNIIRSYQTENNQSCEYNPDYLKFIQIITSIKGKLYRPNIEKIYKYFQKDTRILRKLFYFQAKNNDRYPKFCLGLHNFKQDPMQVPLIYHSRFLRLLKEIIRELDTQSTALKAKITQMIDFNYILNLLSLEDVYTSQSLQAKLNFILKKELYGIIYLYLDKPETMQRFYQNHHIITLLDHYIKVFLDKPNKLGMHGSKSGPYDSLYKPFMQEQKNLLQYYEHNQRQYYQENVKPLLQKILSKFNKMEQRKSNKIYCLATRLIEEVNERQLTSDYKYKKQNQNKIDQVRLKWRNFVDHDPDNPDDQRYVKENVLEFLQNSKTTKIIQQESTQFYSLISPYCENYIKVVVQLLNLEMEDGGNQNSGKNTDNIKLMLWAFEGYLASIYEGSDIDVQMKVRVRNYLIKQNVIDILIAYTNESGFQLQQLAYRVIFYKILRILNFIIMDDKDLKVTKYIYKYFRENIISWRFLKHLKSAILLVSKRVQRENIIEQVTRAFSEIYLCVENRNFELDKEALAFIKELCNYSYFTSFLRFQQLYQSTIDFLEILYNSLKHLLVSQNNRIGLITIDIVRSSERILDCISAMMVGPNQSNQNYIIDNKFPEIVNKVLKIMNIQNQGKVSDIMERDRLKNEVIEFYKQNGIDLQSKIQPKINIQDFKHHYLINRLKYGMLKTLLETIAGNEKGFAKIRVQIPIQFLKVYMVWVYNDFIEGKYNYTEDIILRSKEDWNEVVSQENLSAMFLSIGFFFYMLIEANFKYEKNKKGDDEDSMNEKEKNKQKIVKNFFASISGKQRKLKAEGFTHKQFGSEISKQHDKYYTVLDFFRAHTASIEIGIGSSLNLTRVYFPKIPLCDKISKQSIEVFKHEANRISHDEKIKSLFEFARESYQYAKSQDQYFNRFNKSAPFIGSLMNILKYEDVIYLIGLILALVITILFFVQNFYAPTFSFMDSLVIGQMNQISVVIFVLSLASVLLSFILGVSLFTFKLPLYIMLMRERYYVIQDKVQEGIFQNVYFYVIQKVFGAIGYQFLMMCFLACTFIHPLFAGFTLLQIFNRISLGKQIFRSMRETWVQLLAATFLLLIVNYVYALYIYVLWTEFYGPTCQSLYQCLLFLVDQSLKSDSGFLGSVPAEYVESVINLKFVSEIIYVVFAQKVVFEIFSGTIIDKFSELRQETEETLRDQLSYCYVCGQERFKIDFELEGFEEHTLQNHNSINYIFYIFYLKRKLKSDFGIIEKYVHECIMRKKNDWIPDDNSISKQEKEKLEETEEQKDENKELEVLSRKVKDLKGLRKKTENIIATLKSEQSTMLH